MTALFFYFNKLHVILLIFLAVPLLPLLPELIHGICLWLIPVIPFAIWIFQYLISGYRFHDLPKPIFRFFMVFILFALLSALQAFNIGTSIAETFRYISLFLFIFALFQYILTEKNLNDLTLMIIASTIFMALIALPEILSMNIKDIFLGDFSKNRLASFHENPNNFAIPFLFSIPALFTKVLYPAEIKRYKWLFSISCFLLSGFFIYIVLLTNSRSALLCLFVSLSVILLTIKSGRRLLLLGIVAILAVIPFIWDLLFFALRFQRGLSGRDYLWKAAFRIIKEAPLFGIGPGNFELIKVQYILPMDFLANLTRSIHVSGAAHNTYLSVSAEIGLVASISLVIFLIYSLNKAVKLIRTGQSPIQKQHAVMGTAILAGFMVRSLFETGVIIGSGWIGDNLYFLSAIMIIYFYDLQYKLHDFTNVSIDI
jgi:putative inorganic carbon (HCO3(-)) transporter